MFRRRFIVLPFLVVLFFIAIASTPNSKPSGVTGNIISIAAYSFFLTSIYYKNPDTKIRSIKSIVYILGFSAILYLMSSIHSWLILDVSTRIDVIEASAILLLSLSVVFVLPSYLHLDEFSFAITRFSAMTVLIGIPAIFLGDYTLFTLEFNPYGTLWFTEHFGHQLNGLVPSQTRLEFASGSVN